MPRIQKRDDGQPWYADGLCFACQGCGRCCGRSPGYVWMTKEEMADIARHVGMPVKEFRRTYVRRLWRGLTFKEKPNYDCVMLDGGRCLVYEVRPLQCRVWPFWPSNLTLPQAWRAASRGCPGMDAGPRYAFEQIEALRMEMDG
ncbi:MAG: YkgJ family cysteine cluster protein [Planctomycetes bacterium]|nr:YkgJ family cysteine cluster protein [Planctomycetota bacterium]